MLRLALVASAMTETVDGPPSGGTIVLAAAAIAVIAGICLFLLFRRGSIADRARTDVPDVDTDETGETGEPVVDESDADEGVEGADDLSP